MYYIGMDQDMDMGTDDAAADIQAVDNVDMYSHSET